MPLIHISAPKGALNKNDQGSLVSRLSDAVLRSEGADPRDPAAQALVWAYYSELSTDQCYVGGKNLENSPLTIAVTTPQGALDDRRREQLVKDIGSIVDDLIGHFDRRLNHWVMLHELNDGGWGGGGQIFRLGDIQGAMNIQTAAS